MIGSKRKAVSSVRFLVFFLRQRALENIHGNILMGKPEAYFHVGKEEIFSDMFTSSTQK